MRVELLLSHFGMPFVHLALIIYTTAYRFYSVGINFAFCLFGCVIIW